jgi:hypothetical protein
VVVLFDPRLDRVVLVPDSDVVMVDRKQC